MGLAEEIEAKLSEYDFKSNFKEASIFLFKEDGSLLFKSKNNSYIPQDSSLGALLTGAWQAVNAVSKIMDNKNDDYYRFSFDTSSQGVYLLDLHVGRLELYIGLLFKDEINPAPLRFNLNNFKTWLEENLKLEIQEKNEDFLFDDITDQEVENLFKSAGI
jgi:hypothetical protein